MLDRMLTTTTSSHRRRLPGGRPFHLILVGLATSALGDWLYNVALLALIFGRTGSATWVALTTAARVLPVVVLGPLGGVLADRHDRRALMIGADVIRMVLMAALAAVAAAGLPIVLAPVLAAMATAAGTVTSPSVAASTARLVADDELQRANALRSAIGQGAIVAGPALGAVDAGAVRSRGGDPAQRRHVRRLRRRRPGHRARRGVPAAHAVRRRAAELRGGPPRRRAGAARRPGRGAAGGRRRAVQRRVRAAHGDARPGQPAGRGRRRRLRDPAGRLRRRRSGRERR